MYLSYTAYHLAQSESKLYAATAAALVEQPNRAANLYQQANAGSNLGIAFNHMKQIMSLHGTQKKSTLRFAKSLKPQLDSFDWKRVLRWFPADTETVLTLQGPYRIKKQLEIEDAEFIRLSHLNQLRTFQVAMPDDDDKRCAEVLRSSTVWLSMRGARDFLAPSGLGGGSWQGADVTVFARDSNKAPEQLLTILASRSQYRTLIEGVEVLVFDEVPTTIDQCEATYICSPCKGTLVIAYNLHYLEQMLARLGKEPNDRALPPDLVEWKHVDATAEGWAIRHYDLSHNPFDRSTLLVTADTVGKDCDINSAGGLLDSTAVGVVVHFKGDGSASLKYLTPNKIMQKRRLELFQCAIEQHKDSKKFRFDPLVKDVPMQMKVIVDANSICLEGRPNIPLSQFFLMIAMDACGFMINI